MNMSKFEQKQREMFLEDNPNINKSGNVIFTFFAGIESINSMVQLDSLKPLKKTAINRYNNENDDFHTSPKKKGAGGKDKEVVGGEDITKKQHTESNKYQTFIYNVMTKIRQVYKIDKRVEILDD